MKFRVFYVNLGWYALEDFATLDEAIAYGKSKGWEFAVHHGSNVVAGWDFFGGLRRY
jgi:hypothetical protein